MNRLAVTEKIISTKVSKGLKWEDIAKKVGHSKEWTTALCLGQMTATPAQAKILGKIFGTKDQLEIFTVDLFIFKEKNILIVLFQKINHIRQEIISI